MMQPLRIALIDHPRLAGEHADVRQVLDGWPGLAWVPVLVGPSELDGMDAAEALVFPGSAVEAMRLLSGRVLAHARRRGMACVVLDAECEERQELDDSGLLARCSFASLAGLVPMLRRACGVQAARARQHADAQLALPLAQVSGSDVLAAPALGLTLRATRLSGAVRLELDVVAGGRTSVTARLLPEAERVHEQGGAVVSRTAMFDPTGRIRPLDPFAPILDELPCVAPDGGADPSALVEVDRFVAQARTWLLEIISPAARKLARTFDPRIRTRVTSWIAADETGRVGQLVRSCPGLLVLAAQLASESPEAVCEMLSRVVQGRRLREAAAPVLHAWSHRFRHAWTASIDRQWAFVCRAPKCVGPNELLMPIPPGVALDDAPRHWRTWQSWLGAITCVGLLVSADATHRAAEVVPFVSANGAALWRTCGSELPLLLSRLVQRSLDTGRWPTRRSSIARVIAPLDALLDHDGLYALPIEPLAPPPPQSGIEAQLLETPAELEAEGVLMQHCVRDRYTAYVARGVALVYALTLDDTRYTLSVLSDDEGRPEIAELAGIANARPKPEVRARVAAWVSGRET